MVKIGDRFGRNHMVEISMDERLAYVSCRSQGASLGKFSTIPVLVASTVQVLVR